MLAARAKAAATEVTNAALEGEAAEAKDRIVMGTVHGDVHDIGKAIVIAYQKANGLEVTDLGRDVPAETFMVDRVEHGRAAQARRLTSSPGRGLLRRQVSRCCSLGRCSPFARGSPGSLPTCVTLVTGPSASADVVGVRTLGVHGPGEVHVWLIENE